MIYMMKWRCFYISQSNRISAFFASCCNLTASHWYYPMSVVICWHAKQSCSDKTMHYLWSLEPVYYHMFLHTSMLLSELSAVQNLFYSSLRSTYILTYTLFDLEFRVARDKLVSSSSSIVLNTTKIVKLTTF